MKTLGFKNVVPAILAMLVAGPVLAQTVPRLELSPLVSGADRFAWKIKKASWSETDEAEYSAFVQGLGAAIEAKKCNTVAKCMKSSANPFFSTDPAGLRYYADCADLPYFLRAYFAWKKGLPFSFVSGISLRDPNDPGKKDIRYTKNGNKPWRRTDSAARAANQFVSAKDTLNWIIGDHVSTATMRMPGIPVAGEANGDFYAIPLQRGHVRPGTLIYSADGHAAVVYQIQRDGLIKTIDAHPDNSITLTAYGTRFLRGNPNVGAIFKNFRPVELVGAQADAEGNLVGGSVRVKPDTEISQVNYEQIRTKIGSNSEFYAWVRQRVAETGFKIDIVQDFKTSTETLCRLVSQRREAVDHAIAAQVDKKNNPDRMVRNIFGAEGEWETYSSPGRDVSLRIGYKSALDSLKFNVTRLRSGDPTYVYTGTNLSSDLFAVYKQVAASCPLVYTSRSGVRQSLDLEQVRLRLFKISFDPYHCIDLRWGDVAAGERVCGEDMRWYNAEQYLRNLTVRDLESNHGLSIEEMEIVNADKNSPPAYD
ncbi:MAG TPA: hypothetical protein VM432_07470, partial [Bdellovibrionales bacterium]|nr:hypothetical protein [Bdellovibrionales bacterium]